MIRKAKVDDYDDIVDLWTDAFGYDDFARCFFENIFNINNVLVYEVDNMVVANIQRIPYEIKDFGKVTYVYGACTKLEYRNRGIMGKLLEYSEKIDRSMGKVAIILIPENENLFSFYDKKGYDKRFYRYLMKKEDLEYMTEHEHEHLYIKNDGVYIEEINLGEISLYNKDNDILGGLKLLYNNNNIDNYYVIRDDVYFYNQLKLYCSMGGKLFIARNKKSIVGYAFGYIENGFNITELIYVDLVVRNKIVEKLKELFFHINVLNELKGSKKIEYGCIKILQKELNVNKIIINLMYD